MTRSSAGLGQLCEIAWPLLQRLRDHPIAPGLGPVTGGAVHLIVTVTRVRLRLYLREEADAADRAGQDDPRRELPDLHDTLAFSMTVFQSTATVCCSDAAASASALLRNAW